MISRVRKGRSRAPPRGAQRKSIGTNTVLILFTVVGQNGKTQSGITGKSAADITQLTPPPRPSSRQTAVKHSSRDHDREREKNKRSESFFLEEAFYSKTRSVCMPSWPHLCASEQCDSSGTSSQAWLHGSALQTLSGCIDGVTSLLSFPRLSKATNNSLNIPPTAQGKRTSVPRDDSQVSKLGCGAQHSVRGLPAF